MVQIEPKGFKSPQYREITPDYVYGGIKPGYIEAIFNTAKPNVYSAMVDKIEIFEHTEEVDLKLTPQMARALVIWLLKNIKTYEANYGKTIVKEKEELDLDGILSGI